MQILFGRKYINACGDIVTLVSRDNPGRHSLVVRVEKAAKFGSYGYDGMEYHLTEDGKESHKGYDLPGDIVNEV